MTTSLIRSTRVDGYEVWFRGVHSNVGGGYADRGLFDIALRWMLEKAESCGLTFDLSKMEALKPDINGKFGKPNDPRLDPPRKLKPGDRVHPSAYECKGERETRAQRSEWTERLVPDTIYLPVRGGLQPPGRRQSMDMGHVSRQAWSYYL